MLHEVTETHRTHSQINESADEMGLHAALRPETGTTKAAGIHCVPSRTGYCPLFRLSYPFPPPLAVGPPKSPPSISNAGMTLPFEPAGGDRGAG